MLSTRTDTQIAKLAVAVSKRLGQPLVMRYVAVTGDESQHTIVPYAIIRLKKGYGVWAYCLEREAMRRFYFGSIVGCDPTTLDEDVELPTNEDILYELAVGTKGLRNGVANGTEWLREIRPWFTE